MPKTVAIIPARYASTRLPGKLIKQEALKHTGKYLIEHVYEKVKKARNIDKIIVATDDERIFEVVKQFGGCVKMSSTDHSSGTDRVAEIAADMDADFIVNIQGDEPDVNGSMIDSLVDVMYAEKDAQVCTFANELISMGEFSDPNAVKVVVDKDDYAMYFSRATIPYIRDNMKDSGFSEIESYSDKAGDKAKTSFPFLKHLGIYMYRKDFLLKYSTLAIPAIEDIEKLEQLRILYNGYKIKVVLTPYRCEGVDSPEDFKRFVERYRL